MFRHWERNAVKRISNAVKRNDSRTVIATCLSADRA